MGKIIDGTKTAEEIQKDIKAEVEKLSFQPGLAIVRVGNDPASEVYTGIKKKTAEKLGIKCEICHLPEGTEQETIDKVHEINKDKTFHGLIVQLPLPENFDEEKILAEVSTEKDVDCLNPFNIGRLSMGKPLFTPATPTGIITLLDKYNFDPKGKEVVIIGRSNIVGKPLSIMLTKRNATVTLCHTKTKDLSFHTKRADILIVAAGKPKLITADMVSKNQAIIDVGVNRTESGLVGDVDFENIKDKVAAITPVPGGVGPMTVTSLMQNVMKAARGDHD